MPVSVFTVNKELNSPTSLDQCTSLQSNVAIGTVLSAASTHRLKGAWTHTRHRGPLSRLAPHLFGDGPSVRPGLAC